MSFGRTWTADEDEVLRAAWAERTQTPAVFDYALAPKLKRTGKAVFSRRQALGLLNHRKSPVSGEAIDGSKSEASQRAEAKSQSDAYLDRFNQLARKSPPPADGAVPRELGFRQLPPPTLIGSASC